MKFSRQELELISRALQLAADEQRRIAGVTPTDAARREFNATADEMMALWHKIARRER
jgi:hypothetical protein